MSTDGHSWEERLVREILKTKSRMAALKAHTCVATAPSPEGFGSTDLAGPSEPHDPSSQKCAMRRREGVGSEGEQEHRVGQLRRGLEVNARGWVCRPGRQTRRRPSFWPAIYRHIRRKTRRQGAGEASFRYESTLVVSRSTRRWPSSGRSPLFGDTASKAVFSSS